MSEHTALHRRFHAHGVHVGLGQGDLARVMVPGEHGAELYLHGAHLTHWQPAGERPVVWLSPRSAFAEGKAIRGGIPLCFPWFGPHPQDQSLPMHGFARLTAWELTSVERLDEDRVSLSLQLGTSPATRAQWPYDFTAQYRIVIGKELELELVVTNNSLEALTYSEALHTYLAVGDIDSIRIHGLHDCDFIDKVRGGMRDHEGRPLITISGEVDRMYLCERSRYEIEDPAWQRRLIIEKQGSGVTVVWNPGHERCLKMADMEPTSYQHFVCLESANAATRLVTLAPGQEHRLTTRICVQAL